MIGGCVESMGFCTDELESAARICEHTANGTLRACIACRERDACNANIAREVATRVRGVKSVEKEMQKEV